MIGMKVTQKKSQIRTKLVKRVERRCTSVWIRPEPISSQALFLFCFIMLSADSLVPTSIEILLIVYEVKQQINRLPRFMYFPNTSYARVYAASLDVSYAVNVKTFVNPWTIQIRKTKLLGIMNWEES